MAKSKVNKPCSILILIASYVIRRLILFSCLVSLLFFMSYRFLVGLYLSRKYKQTIEFVKAEDAQSCITYERLLLFQSFDGTCNINNLRDRIDERWLRPINTDGRFKHEKLGKQLKLEFGYYFWIQGPEFCIDKHVISNNNIEINDKDDLCQFLQETTLPLDDGIFWQFVIVNLPENLTKNIKKQHLLFFHSHPALMDPISLNKMYNRLFDDDISDIYVTEESPSNSLIDKISFWIKLLGYSPYQFTKELEMKEENNFLLGSIGLRGSDLITISNPIPLDGIKEMEKSINIIPNEIFTACAAGALRAYFISKNKPIPSKMTFNVPVSFHKLSATSVKVENNVAFRRVSAPIDQPTCLKRLIKSKNVPCRQTTPILYFTHTFLKLYVNKFPLYVTKLIMRRFTWSIIVNCLRLSSPNDLLNNKPLQQQVCLPVANRNINGCSVALTFALDENNFIFTIQGDLGIIKTRENIDKLRELVEIELKKMRK